jgi:hypothetical protein
MTDRDTTTRTRARTPGVVVNPLHGGARSSQAAQCGITDVITNCTKGEGKPAVATRMSGADLSAAAQCGWRGLSVGVSLNRVGLSSRTARIRAGRACLRWPSTRARRCGHVCCFARRLASRKPFRASRHLCDQEMAFRAQARPTMPR